MQESNFNSLFIKADEKGLSEIKWVPDYDFSKIKTKGSQPALIAVDKEDFESQEQPVPDNIVREIRSFIDKERRAGTKERTIRRMVERIWSIQVVQTTQK